MSSRLARLDLVVAEAATRTADLDVNVADGPDFTTRFLSVELGANVAEGRTCAVVLDVLIDTGVQADLDVLVEATSEAISSLQVYIKSAELQIGASALYLAEADEVESILYVEDDQVLHPEFVIDMTATLLHKGKIELGTLSFNFENGIEDGTIVLSWHHPAHNAELSIRFRGNLENFGEVDFTVDVKEDHLQEIPLSENVLEGIDIEAPRTEPSSNQTQVQRLDAAPEEVENVAAPVVLVLFKLNLLSQYEFLEVGTGSIEYTGGGNRLLTALADDGSFIFQPKNDFPPTVVAHTRLEAAGSNLLTTSDFLTPTSTADPTPLGWTLTAPSSVTTLLELIADSSGINQFRIRSIGSGPYVGPKKLTFSHDASVAATPADPITFSILARTQFNNADVIVKDLRLVISFRDGADAEISQSAAEFAPEDIVGNNLALLQHTVAVPPVGTVAARVSIEMESIEASDDTVLFLMAPQVETNSIATSRIVGPSAPTNRSVDLLRVTQRQHIEFRKGSIITLLAPDYEDKPAADVCLFDSRSAAGLNGFAVFHKPDGKLEFTVAGPVSAKTIETNLTFDFEAGVFQEVGVSWATSFMEIQLNGDQVALDETAVVLPQDFNEFIYLFRTAADTLRLEGELASFEIRRDVQQ